MTSGTTSVRTTKPLGSAAFIDRPSVRATCWAVPQAGNRKVRAASRFVLFPLKNGFELIGYIWATNFDTEKTMHIKETLELTTYFIASEISSYQMFDRFRILSTVDMLTGVLNRNEMNNRVMQLGLDDRPNRKNIGVVVFYLRAYAQHI